MSLTSFIYALVAIICGVVTVRAAMDVRSHLFKVAMFAGLGVIHGLVPAMTPAHLLEIGFSSRARWMAACYALACVVMLVAGWSVVGTRHVRRRPHIGDMMRVFGTPGGQRFLRWMFWAGVVIGILGLLLIKRANHATLAEMLRGSRFEFRQTRNPLLFNLGTYLTSFALVPGLVGLFLPRRYHLPAVLYTCAYALLSLYVFSKGTRSLPVGLLGTFLVAYLMRQRPTAGQLTGMACGTALLLALAIGLYEGRKYMAHQSAAETIQFLLSPDAYTGALTRDPLNYNECLVGAIHCFPDAHPYLNMGTYRRALFFFLPSSQFPVLKPRDPNATFGEVVFNTPYQWDVTIPPSIPGDLYINFWGWPGVVVMFVYGMIGAFVDRLVATDPLWFAVIGSQAVRLVVLGLRGQPYDLYVNCLIVMMFAYAVARLCPYSLRRLKQDMRQMVAQETDHLRRRQSIAAVQRAPRGGRRAVA